MVTILNTSLALVTIHPKKDQSMSLKRIKVRRCQTMSLGLVEVLNQTVMTILKKNVASLQHIKI